MRIRIELWHMDGIKLIPYSYNNQKGVLMKLYESDFDIVLKEEHFNALEEDVIRIRGKISRGELRFKESEE